MVGHKVKCKVYSSSAFKENPQPKPVYDKYTALNWVIEVGFYHVAHGECSLPKCVSSKVYIDKGWIKLTGNNKPTLDWVTILK